MANKDLIKLDDLFKCETCVHHRYGGCDTWCDTGESYRPDASKLTKVDAAPVVHGRWIKPTVIGGKGYDIPHCSVCDGVPCGVNENTKFCPNCGAKMDGDAPEQEEDEVCEACVIRYSGEAEK